MIWKSTLLTTLIVHLISSGGGQKIDPEILLESSFPPARPSVNNLFALCLNGNGRLRYPEEYFPSSSYAFVRRAGMAVNRVEAWFSDCCFGGLAHGKVQILCCAEQAWETALSHFCIEEYSTMTAVFECCEMKGDERWDCFERRAPNPSYQSVPGYFAPLIPPDRTLVWDPNTC